MEKKKKLSHGKECRRTSSLKWWCGASVVAGSDVGAAAPEAALWGWLQEKGQRLCAD
jgi:hypothetical protein